MEQGVRANCSWLTMLRLLVVSCVLVSAPSAADAQSAAGKVPRVGLLGVASESGYARQIEAFRQGLRDLGNIEGRSIIIEYLLTYGVSFPELWRRGAHFVDKILKGEKPATIPVEQATKFELVVNAKTAKSMGVSIRQSLLVRADHVIE
jgi:hypothetical protein